MRKKLNKEVLGISALLDRPHPTLTSLTSRTFGLFDVLKQLYSKFSTALPHNIVATSIPCPIPDTSVEALTFNFDEGHSGRFTIPAAADVGASLPFDYVYTTPDPAAYIRTHLSFQPPLPPDPSAPQIFFAPGLNTLHQPAEGETSTPHRLAHYVRVLLYLPMAQIHIGTQMDQGDAELDASSSPFLRRLLKIVSPLLPERGRPIVDGKHILWKPTMLDAMQAALSQFNVIDTPLKQCFRKLLDNTRGPHAQPVTFVVFSRAAIELMAALHKHVEKSDKLDESKMEMKERLRKFVTVLTIGVPCNNFPDGPAYIHLSSWTDPLTKVIGVNPKRTSGAGKDAVFLTCDSPWNEKASDNHNFGAVTAQYLTIVMRANAVRSLRTLWELGQGKGIIIPENATELIKALIVLTRSKEWLFIPEEAMEGLSEDAFPNDEEAATLLAEGLGREFVHQVGAAFPSSLNDGSCSK